MTPFPNVYRRPGTSRWRFALPAPRDLSHHFKTQWACRASLGTSELREANAKAKELHAEWEKRFATLRRLDNPIELPALAEQLAALPVTPLTPQLIQEAAELLYSRMLESDEASRLAGLSAADYANQEIALARDDDVACRLVVKHFQLNHQRHPAQPIRELRAPRAPFGVRQGLGKR